MAHSALLGNPVEAIIVGDGTTSNVLYSTGASFARVENPALNNSGTVAFRARMNDGTSEIVSGNGGPTTVIADTKGQFSDFSFTSINSSGQVGFYANLRSGGEGVYVGDGTTLRTVADTTGAFSSFGSSFCPGINDAGEVAFYATLKSGGSGIFTGPDPVLDEVIASGDTLFGKTITSFGPYGFFGQGLNDEGEIAFEATFSDGSSGLFRADPVASVPEPTSIVAWIGLSAMGMIVIWRRRFKRR